MQVLLGQELCLTLLEIFEVIWMAVCLSAEEEVKSTLVGRLRETHPQKWSVWSAMSLRIEDKPARLEDVDCRESSLVKVSDVGDKCWHSHTHLGELACDILVKNIRPNRVSEGDHKHQ